MKLHLNLDNIQALKEIDSIILHKTIGPIINILSASVSVDDKCSILTRSNKVIGKALQDANLTRGEFKIENTDNKHIKQLFESIDEVLIRNLNNYTRNYSKEELLISLVRTGGILSQLSFAIFSDLDQNYGYINKDNNIDTLMTIGQKLRNAKDNGGYDPRAILGELKGTVELGINTILLNKIDYSEQNSKNSVEVGEFIELLNARLVLKNMLDALIVGGEKRKETILSIDEGIVLPLELIDCFLEYSNDTLNESINISEPTMNEMLMKFKEYSNYSPIDFQKYLVSENKALRMDNVISIIPKGLINCDLMLGFKFTEEGANSVVRDLTINNEKFYKYISNEEIDEKKLMGDRNFRLFRAPIIDCGEYLMASPLTLLEATNPLRLRILSRDVLPSAPKNINEIGKRAFDEAFLGSLREELQNRKNIDVHINVDLMSSDLMKRILSPESGIKKELDFVYTYNETLYVWDLKNYGLQFNFSNVYSVLNKIKKEKKKFRKLANLLSSHRSEFLNIIGENFKEVKFGILTVNTSAFKYFKKQDEIPVLSVEEFIHNIIEN